ncbi:uncharacterized protein LOC132203917 isoform X2 [Neocloeon triangulifer]|uniref:uncharacterized protein LOC132203917 isoform X2 n=1 Tax=Neocloeon triangulifer TaxID=2078957 RepID=UPI00286EF473|nr:uncharacterized protein LOC132203917 isoform X2 [Neocloeon triangulifer]
MEKHAETNENAEHGKKQKQRAQDVASRDAGSAGGRASKHCNRYQPSNATPAKTRSHKTSEPPPQEDEGTSAKAEGKAQQQQKAKFTRRLHGPKTWKVWYRNLLHACASFCLVNELAEPQMLLEKDEYIDECILRFTMVNKETFGALLAGKDPLCPEFLPELTKHLEWLRNNPADAQTDMQKRKEEENNSQKSAPVLLEPEDLPWILTDISDSSKAESRGEKTLKPSFVSERWHSGGEEQVVSWPEPPFKVKRGDLPRCEKGLRFVNNANSYRCGDKAILVESYCAYACIVNILLALIREEHVSWVRAIVSKQSPEPLLKFITLASQPMLEPNVITREMVFYAMEAIRMVTPILPNAPACYEASLGEVLNRFEFVSGTAVTFCTKCGDWSVKKLGYLPPRDLENVVTTRKFPTHNGTCMRKLGDTQEMCGGKTFTQNRPNRNGFLTYRDRIKMDSILMSEAIKKAGAPKKFTLGNDLQFRLFGVMFAYQFDVKEDGQDKRYFHTVPLIFPQNTTDSSFIRIIDCNSPTKENLVTPGGFPCEFNQLGSIFGHVYVRNGPSK